MPGSVVSTRSSLAAARSVPSATATMPAWIDRPMPDAAAVVDGDPRRAGCGVDHGVEQGPVGDGVGAVGHRLRLPVGRRHRPGVEVVAPDHDRRRQLTRAHHLVEAQAEPLPLAVAEPADPRREALEGDPLTGQADPPGQPGVVGELLEHGPVGRGDVGRIARQGHPAEGTLALAEQRSDVGRQEAGVVEGPVEPAEPGLGAQRVAVVEHLAAPVEEARPSPRSAPPSRRGPGGSAPPARCGPARRWPPA